MTPDSFKLSPRIAAALVLAALISAASPSLAAKDDSEADAKIQSMTVQLKELEVEDERNVATAELGQAEALLSKARSIIGERKERDALGQTLEEAEATLSLAGGKIVQADAKAALDAQKDALRKTEASVDDVRAEVSKLDEEQATLDAQLSGGGK